MTFLDAMVYDLVDGYKHFEGTCYLHFLGGTNKLHGVTYQITITLILVVVIITNPSCDF
jgi:hypothetical protein